MKQLPSDLSFRQLAGRDEFIVSDCNALALASIDQWPNWQGNYRALKYCWSIGCRKITSRCNLAVSGSKQPEINWVGSGVNGHQIQPFYVLDDVTSSAAWDEEALFHCFNRCASMKGGILLAVANASGANGLAVT